LGLTFVSAFGLTLSWTRVEILKFLALSSALQVTVDFAAELLSGITPWRSAYQFSGMLGYNREAYVCSVLILSALCALRLKQPGRWIYQLLAIYGFIFLLLTRSRGGQLAFAAGLVLYFLVCLNLRQRFAAVLGIGTLALVVLISGIAPTLLLGLNRGGEGSENFNGRGPLWEELMTYANRHPFSGYGYENFWTIATIDNISADQGWAMSDSHSGYIESLLQLGWPGAILHTLTLLASVAVGIRLFRQTGDYAFFLAATLCLIYIVGGLLEGLMIIKASATSFDLALLLCVLAVRVQCSSESSATTRMSVGTYVR
jgi:O-antigen ligase